MARLLALFKRIRSQNSTAPAMVCPGGAFCFGTGGADLRSASDREKVCGLIPAMGALPTLFARLIRWCYHLSPAAIGGRAAIRYQEVAYPSAEGRHKSAFLMIRLDLFDSIDLALSRRSTSRSQAAFGRLFSRSVRECASCGLRSEGCQGTLQASASQ